MERIYNDLKFFKTKQFKTKKEENEYFIRIQDENIIEYKNSLIFKFEDYYHVMWSRKFLSIILSFIFLFLSIITYKILIISLILLSISLGSMLLSKYFQIKLNKKAAEENFVMFFLEKHINEEMVKN